MKKTIHPEYFGETKVTCACGATYHFGSTRQNIHVELCQKCHPFYTGAQRFVDTANKIDKFNKKRDVASKFKVTVAAKKEEEKQRNQAPKSLAEMLAALK